MCTISVTNFFRLYLFYVFVLISSIYYICLSILGDAEALLGLGTYQQDAICTCKTVFLVLEMRHFERLVLRRHLKSVDLMFSDLNLKSDRRLSKRVGRRLPLLKWIVDRTSDHITTRLKQNRKRTKLSLKAQQLQSIGRAKTLVDDTDYIPPRGALIDIHGPGTVFFYIRQRYLATLRYHQKREAMERDTGLASNEMLRPRTSVRGLQMSFDARLYDAGYLTRKKIQEHMPRTVPTDDVRLYSPDCFNPEDSINDLQRRMHVWLVNDNTKTKQQTFTLRPISQVSP